jgi:hypothetical protein
MTHYADGLLANGEHVVLVRRQHWFTLLDAGKWAIAGLVGAFILLVVSGNLPADGPGGALRQLFGVAIVVLLVIAIAYLVYVYLRWTNDVFVLTNRRVMQIRGIINKRTTDSSLEKINDAVLSQSMFGRMFGFGDLDILTASEAGIDRMRMLVDAMGFKRAMIESKHELELELSRGPIMSPPLRAPVDVERERVERSVPVAPPPPPVQAAPEPPVTPPAPPARTMSSEEVTRTLGSLADLRDRGAISPEEYEAKKADLLGRL